MDEISLKVSYAFSLKIVFHTFCLKTYEALAYHVTQSTMNRQRMRTVSLWSLQMTASAVLSALRHVVDPVSLHFREAYLSGHGLYDAAHMGPPI